MDAGLTIEEAARTMAGTGTHDEESRIAGCTVLRVRSPDPTRTIARAARTIADAARGVQASYAPVPPIVRAASAIVRVGFAVVALRQPAVGEPTPIARLRCMGHSPSNPPTTVATPSGAVPPVTS
jgi:hypothetical protein